MESVELHGKVDNIGKVGEMTSLGIILMLHISLKGIFFSSSMGDSYYHLPLGVNVKWSSKIVILDQDHHEKIKIIEHDLDHWKDRQIKKDLWIISPVQYCPEEL